MACKILHIQNTFCILLFFTIIQCNSQNSTSVLTPTPLTETLKSSASALNTTPSLSNVSLVANGSSPVTTTVASGNNATVAVLNTTTFTNGTNATEITSTNTTICRASLSGNPNLAPFWVTTVISVVPTTTDITNCSWRDLMETRLLTWLTTARSLSSNSGKRRKRAATSGELTLQLVSATRSSSAAGNNTKVTLVFYVLLNAGYLPASSVVASLSTASFSAASVLGYTIDSLPTAYEALQTKTSYLWLIGAMFGSLAGIVLITWGVLFAYQHCLRPCDPEKQQRASWATAIDDFYGDGAMAHVPDGRANPKIGFSKADIGTIADEVARHLDSHMSELAANSVAAGRSVGVDSPADRSPPRRQAAEQLLPAPAEVEEPRIAAARAGPALQSGMDWEAAAMPQMPPIGAGSSERAAGLATSEQESSDCTADTEGTFIPVIANPLHAVEAIQPDTAAPAPDADHLLMTPRGDGTHEKPLSPYRTGDHLARIRPILEQDLRLQEQQAQPPICTQPQAPSPHSEPVGGPRLISVMPRSQSAFSGGGVAAPPPSMVRSANQDEWDVVRELARQPQSDNRALLGTVRREVAEFTYADPTSAAGMSMANAAWKT